MYPQSHLPHSKGEQGRAGITSIHKPDQIICIWLGSLDKDEAFQNSKCEAVVEIEFFELLYEKSKSYFPFHIEL